MNDSRATIFLTERGLISIQSETQGTVTHIWPKASCVHSEDRTNPICETLGPRHGELLVSVPIKQSNQFKLDN